MRIAKEDTALVGISEFRTRSEAILNELKTHKIIIERRNRPVAILLPIEKYEQMEEVFEWVEDHALGFLAKERERSTPKAKYLSLKELEKKVGLL